MTFEEYYNKFRDTLTDNMSYEDVIGVGWCDRFIFPTIQEREVYTPFTYTAGTEDGVHGGEFAKLVSSRIFNNFREAEVSKVLSIPNVTNNVPLRIRVGEIMREYQYKWHALFESTQVDGDYDILDNVNEITSETVTRVPELEEVTDDSFTRGAISGEESYDNGQRTVTDNGGNNYGVYPNDDDITQHPYNANTTSNTHVEQLVTDSHEYSENSRSDSRTTIKSESGSEETTLDRRRHGNIGVTTSGQLIRDFRLTHDFNLVKIVADDIANELFTGAWC